MASEGFVYPSPQWAEAFCKAINENQEYREAAKDWRWDVAFVATEIPDNVADKLSEILGLPKPRDLGVKVNSGAIKLVLRNGTCQGSEFYIDLPTNLPPNVSVPANVKIGKVDADFILEATYSFWKDIITGKADPVAALLSRKIKVKKGSFLTLIQYSSAAVKLANTTRNVPTKFVD